MFNPASGLEGADTLVWWVIAACCAAALLAYLITFLRRKPEDRRRIVDGLVERFVSLVEGRGIALVYGTMAFWVLSGALIDPAGRVAGAAQSDVWKHLWGHWWVRDSILRGEGLPLHTHLVNSPLGGSLYCIDPLDALLSIPLQALFGLTASFNIQLFIHLLLGALAAFLLVRHLTKDRPSALIAGTAYAFSPYVLAYPVSSGVTETANIEWLPLYVLFLMKTSEEPGWRNPAAAAIFLFLTSFSCWYYGYIALLFTALWWVWGLVSHLRTRRRGEAASRLPLAGMTVMMGLFCAMILMPALAFKRTIESTDSLLPPYVAQRTEVNVPEHLSPSFSNSSRLEDAVRPGKGNLNVTAVTDLLMRSSYAGFIVLLLAAAGAGGGQRGRFWWLFCALLFLLLAAGPYLMVTSSIHLSGPNSPLYRIFLHFPLFSKIAIPFRFTLLVTLALAVLAAFGYRRISEGYSRRERAFFSLVLSAQILLEFFLLSPAPYPACSAKVSIPAIYAELKKENDDFTILDLPATRGTTRLNVTEYFFYQTIHGKGIPYHISGAFDRSLLRNPFTSALVDLGQGKSISPADLGRMEAGLKTLVRTREIKYILVHEHLLEPQVRVLVRRVLSKHLGSPERFSDGEFRILKYRIY
jgi:hypothetical protein